MSKIPGNDIPSKYPSHQKDAQTIVVERFYSHEGSVSPQTTTQLQSIRLSFSHKEDNEE